MQRNGTYFALITLLLLAVLAYLGVSGWFKSVQQLTVEGSSLVIQASPDGHFRVKGRINQYPVIFMIDTGATGIAVNEKVARAAALTEIGRTFANTANGRVRVGIARIQSLQVENISVQDLPATIMPKMSDTALLGMRFLKHFEWSRQGDTLRLTPIH